MAPRPECAPLWHPQVLPRLTGVRLTIYIGQHPFVRYLINEFEKVCLRREHFYSHVSCSRILRREIRCGS